MPDLITTTQEHNLHAQNLVNERYVHKTQLEKLRNLFERRAGMWIPLPDILKTGCAQYNARIYDLKHDTHHPMNIVNRTETVEGVKHSWYKYTQDEANGQQRLF